VALDVSDARWDQFAYQFSHELCHIFTNFEHRAIESTVARRDQHWFEEALCESMSLLALGRIATSWEQSPPHSHWRAYAPAFRLYAARLSNEAHRRLPADLSFAAWYAANRTALERNPYLRKKNELVAAAILPLLEQAPGALEAAGCLNLDTSIWTGWTGNFSDYVARWRDSCPQAHNEFFSELTALFEEPYPPGGIAAAGTTPDPQLF